MLSTGHIVLVAAGGMVGCVCRFVTVAFVVRLLPFTFPFGTFAVNVIGSFVMGAAAGLSTRAVWLNEDWRVFLTAGFCGGFTTFSAFAFENVELLIQREYTTFALYSILSFVLCIAASLLGFLLTKT